MLDQRESRWAFSGAGLSRQCENWEAVLEYDGGMHGTPVTISERPRRPATASTSCSGAMTGLSSSVHGWGAGGGGGGEVGGPRRALQVAVGAPGQTITHTDARRGVRGLRMRP